MTSDPTSPEKVASIDIGTNTILLLIAKVEEGKVNPLFEIETVARLGEGVQKNGILLKEAMDRSHSNIGSVFEMVPGDWRFKKSLLPGQALSGKPRTQRIF